MPRGRRPADLADVARQIADRHRDSGFPELDGRPWREVWAALLLELRARCPDHGDEELSRALDQGFSDTR